MYKVLSISRARWKAILWLSTISWHSFYPWFLFQNDLTASIAWVFTNQHEWWIFPIQFLRNGFCYVIWHARKSCSKGHHISQKDRCSTFSVTENYPEQECQQTAVSDVLPNRQEFIWEQTINWVQNFIVLHKSDLLYKAISLNNNKPRPAAKLFSLEVQENYFFSLSYYR